MDKCPVSEFPAAVAERSQPAPIQVLPEIYWELRFRGDQHVALVQQAQAQIQASKAKLDALLTSAGLDPNRQYRLDDATKTAIPV